MSKKSLSYEEIEHELDEYYANSESDEGDFFFDSDENDEFGK